MPTLHDALFPAGEPAAVPDWVVAERARMHVLGDPSWADPFPGFPPERAGVWLRVIGAFCRKYTTFATWDGSQKDRIIRSAVTEFYRLNRWHLAEMRAPLKTPAAELAEHEAMYFDAAA
jgi:hypothetical protein